MVSIFKYVPSSPEFWSPAQSRSPPLHPLLSSVLLTTNPHTSELQGHFSILTKQLLYQCSSSASDSPLLRIAHIRWATVVPFTEGKEKELRFGFALKYREERREFYVGNEEELETWMQALERTCILQDIEEDFSIGEVIGTGKLSVVHSGTNLATGEHVAIRIFDKEELKTCEKHLLALVNEIKVLRELTHSRILALYRVYESLTQVLLVTEFTPGKSLLKQIALSGVFTASEAQEFIQNLLELLKYLEAHSVLHRNITPEHLILTDPMDKTQFKLRSFAFATKVSGRKLRDVYGTPGYMAPEILLRRPYGPTVDLYSAGVVFYVILRGFSPFYSAISTETIKKNVKNEIFFDDLYAKMDAKWVKLVETMTNSVAVLRTSASDLLTALSGGIPRSKVSNWRTSALFERKPAERSDLKLFPSLSLASLPVVRGRKSVPKPQNREKLPDCAYGKAVGRLTLN